ncbi:hypothetical protein N7462_002039 [Penicillium macrosclerotiorum]|uniref:uncharacterized protein n=1 Tax=Penicillium macrosclerotiorum TaxID=303699 RepID=UPI0025495B53|nr:uncharacterized protein N7462_002039 [Penicillium macrosclerotiorum]KAJ5692616.1 hypothetical protein N7462_002039 [Penicillium macrosclerotiorum]
MSETTGPNSSEGLNAPVSLLWSYELQRQNGILSSRLLDVKEELGASEKLTETLSKCLNNLIVIIASVATVLVSQSHTSKERLRSLHRQLANAIVLFYNCKQEMYIDVDALSHCIAQLELLYNFPPTIFSSDDFEAFDSLSPYLTSLANAPLVASNASSNRVASMLDGQLSPAEITEITLAMKLEAVMKQEGRPLGEYFDAANEFRRHQQRLGQGNDTLFIEAFLAGCDNRLYRRRLTHALRRDGWYWTWLTHEVMFLILEQEYMDKQEYAIGHSLEDGIYQWPDGTYAYRFLNLPPITEEDLTASEEEA